MFYETATKISIETSNNQEVIDNMPYFVFNNYMVYYNRIKEKEAENTETEQANTDPKSMMNSSMRSAKQAISSIKK